MVIRIGVRSVIKRKRIKLRACFKFRALRSLGMAQVSTKLWRRLSNSDKNMKLQIRFPRKRYQINLI